MHNGAPKQMGEAKAFPRGFDELHPAFGEQRAAVEAERCLQCGGPLEAAPCVSACPTRIDVPRFIAEIAKGMPREAAATIFASNAMGGSCARVCPVDELCEGACVMHKEGRRPVEIARLQRYATDHALWMHDFSQESPKAPTRKESVGVLGAGPAGLACADELASLGYAVTVYESRDLPGGLITYAIAPYKQRTDPAPREAARIQSMGVDIQYGVSIGETLSVEELKARHDAIFLGVGMGADTPAQMEGEHLPGVWKSLDLIEKVKADDMSADQLGDRALVIGGGNTAIDVVRELVRLGVPKVTLVYRRDRESMPAFQHEVDEALEEGVDFRFLTAPKSFVGAKKVTGVECLKVSLAEPDAGGRPRPVAVDGSEHVIEANMVVVAIGQRPRSELFKAFGLDVEGGRVKVDGHYQTSDKRVFAGGDCVTGGSTVVESVKQGKHAARGIHTMLAGAEFALPENPKAGEIKTVHDGPFTKRFQGGFYIGTSEKLCKGCNLCVSSCPTHILFLDAKSKIQVSDSSICVFCGICEQRCPDFAIWVVKDAEKPHSVEVEARRRLTL